MKSVRLGACPYRSASVSAVISSMCVMRIFPEGFHIAGYYGAISHFYKIYYKLFKSLF